MATDSQFHQPQFSMLFIRGIPHRCCSKSVYQTSLFFSFQRASYPSVCHIPIPFLLVAFGSLKSLLSSIAIMQTDAGKGNARQKPDRTTCDRMEQSPPHSPTRQRRNGTASSGVTTPPRRMASRASRNEKVQITLQTPPREVQRRDPGFTPSPKRVRFSVVSSSPCSL